jgi:hypothetical protein
VTMMALSVQPRTPGSQPIGGDQARGTVQGGGVLFRVGGAANLPMSVKQEAA